MSAVGLGAEIGLHLTSAWNNPEAGIVFAVSSRGETQGWALMGGTWPGADCWHNLWLSPARAARTAIPTPHVPPTSAAHRCTDY